MVSDFLSLFFPVLCAACDTPLAKGEECICLACLYNLPGTGFHLHKQNPVAQRFWGKVPVESAASCYYFRKGEKVQRLMHRLKYGQRQDIGRFLGRAYGIELLSAGFAGDVSAIVPVPLHRRKLRRRGYNQSAAIAEGLAGALQKPVLGNILRKQIDSTTQTRKNRYSRWENVKEAFIISSEAAPENAHFLLVDDVITTGSTLESCASILKNIPGSRVSIVTLAFASL